MADSINHALRHLCSGGIVQINGVVNWKLGADSLQIKRHNFLILMVSK
jgi:hypothetical protein